MKCNCINNGNTGALTAPNIKHVQGNVLRLAIPLTLREVEKQGDEMVYTDTDFIPSGDYPVNVVFGKGAVNITLAATMRDGNIAYIEDKGKMPVGTYDITVTCHDGQDNPYRFKQRTVLQVVDATADAGIVTPVEYEVKTWYLDAAVYLALEGKGIEDITTESSGEVGGFNYVTIYLTDGTSRTFTIMNGSGSVDDVFNINSPSPIANKTVTAKFNQIDESLTDLFGYVDYDTASKTIRFYDKGRSKLLMSLDARPFIKDGMVNSVYISNNTLVITFNTDSGREAIGVPLSTVFNPNNYYNRSQVDNKFNNYYTRSQVDTLLRNINVDGYAELEESTGRLKYSQTPDVVLDTIMLSDTPIEEGGNMIYGDDRGHIISVKNDGSENISTDLGVFPHLVFLNKGDNNLYRWNGSEWQQVGGSSGIRAVYDAVNERLIFPTGSAVVVNERLIIS